MPEEVRKSKRVNHGRWKHIVMADRRKAAEARQALSDKLTPQQRLNNLDNLGLTATKERAKLQRLIEAAKNVSRDTKKS